MALAHGGDLGRFSPAVDGSGPAEGPGRVHDLTRREVDVLRLIAQGSSTETAARELHLSAATVKTHLRNASSKLGTASRAAAAAKATSLRLL